MNGSVDLGANLVDLIFSVEVSTNNVVGLNKLVKLSLEILVLLGEQEGVLLKSLQLRLEVKVAVHESLI